MLLSEQLEQFRLYQNQAQSVIRIMVAIGLLVTAIIGARQFTTGVSSDILGLIVSIIEGGRQGQLTHPELTRKTLMMAIYFAILIPGLVLSSFALSLSVLFGDGPLPIEAKLSEASSGTIKDWVIENHERLYEIENQSSMIFFQIWALFPILIFAAFLVFVALFESLQGMLFGGIIGLLFIIAPTLYYLQIAISGIIKTDSASIFDRINGGFQAFADEFRSGINPTIKIAIILFWGIYWDLAVDITIRAYWLLTTNVVAI